MPETGVSSELLGTISPCLLKSLSVANLRAVADQIGDVITDDELADILLKNDMNNDGKLDFEDFYNVLTKKFVYIEV